MKKKQLRKLAREAKGNTYVAQCYDEAAAEQALLLQIVEKSLPPNIVKSLLDMLADAYIGKEKPEGSTMEDSYMQAGRDLDRLEFQNKVLHTVMDEVSEQFSAGEDWLGKENCDTCAEPEPGITCDGETEDGKCPHWQEPGVH